MCISAICASLKVRADVFGFAWMQSAVDRASDPARTSKPVIAQKAEEALAEEIKTARD